ncbi:MAG: hypothetical protein ACTSYB_02815 [Candidatus Helarchaeota archaeon]
MKEKETDFIQLWAEYFKKNPESSRKCLNEFIAAQISLAQTRLIKLPIEKLIQLFDIKNQNIIRMIIERKNSNQKNETS